MDYDSFDTNNELTTEQYDWVRVFDLPDVAEQITNSPVAVKVPAENVGCLF